MKTRSERSVVHADAVAEQRAARAPARRIDREHGYAHVGETAEEAIQDFVGDAALAGAAGAGDADDRHLAPAWTCHSLRNRGQRRFVEMPSSIAEIMAAMSTVSPRSTSAGIVVSRRARHGALDEVVDHLLEPELHAVVRVIDALDAVLHEVADFLGRDRAAAAAEHANVRCTQFVQPVDHVAEELDVAALVGTDRDAVGIFLDGRAHDVVDAAVVAEVNHLGALRLDQAPHDVDRRVVAVEQGRRGYEAQGGVPGRG